MAQDISEDEEVDTIDTATSSSKDHHQEMEYQYEKLESITPIFIRLVVILPGFGTGPIRCYIKAVRLDHSTEYSAVSYTWTTEDGDAKKSQRIHICSAGDQEEQTFLDVTYNCEHALKQLRDSHSQRTVWIDSVCINQNDVQERNMQVSSMDYIFMCANHVDICVNAPDKDFQGAMAELRLHEGMNERSGSRNEYGSSEVELARLKNIEDLFALRYFGRVWVIQEVVSARSVFLHVNDFVAPFAEKILREISFRFLGHNIYAPRQLSHWVDVWQRDIAADIVSIMNMSMACSATDPRDRVFAIIGLLPTNVRSIIPIDYTLTQDHVLAFAANACIRARGDLEILRFAKLPPNADIITASTFGIKDFERFLSQTKWGTKAGQHVYAIMQSQTTIPRNQILPRLKILARFLDRCVHPTGQLLSDLKKILYRRDNPPAPDTEWNWFIDFIRQRCEDGTPDRALLSAIANNIVYACKGFYMREDGILFRGEDSVGFTSGSCAPGDAIFEIFGAPFPFLLREIRPGTYRIVEECYLWAGVSVRYWLSNQLHSGLSYKQPDLSKCRPWTRQVIEVY